MAAVPLPKDVQDAVDQANKIVELIDEDVPDWAKDRAEDFFTDVRQKCVDVAKTMTQLRRVSPKQQSALDGWEKGVRKWMGEKDDD